MAKSGGRGGGGGGTPGAGGDVAVGIRDCFLGVFTVSGPPPVL